MTDRPKIDAAAVEEFYNSTQEFPGNNGVTLRAVCDLALRGLALAAHDREVVSKALRDAAESCIARADEISTSGAGFGWTFAATELRRQADGFRARANAILASATPDKQIRHVCGSAGYGHPNDVCPACEAEDKSRATPSGEKGSGQ